VHGAEQQLVNGEIQQHIDDSGSDGDGNEGRRVRDAGANETTDADAAML